jgi:hypothetical protein
MRVQAFAVLAVAVLVACGDAKTPEPSSAEQRQVSDEARRGCSAFTTTVDEQESNEVFNSRTGELQIFVGQQRFVLSEKATECQQNPVAMRRLAGNRQVQDDNAAP